MTKRSGSENRKRNIVLQLRVDETEKKLIDRAAKTRGISIPELLRRSTFRSIASCHDSTLPK
ncbi:ribbon-helix-helix protein, CopG family [Mycobacterium sp.]|jgi:uncharacterized protein (DUF1778 family)|uniref:plasmid mobilization protein n=1 Tax=Mycobacterium sp. TaxID=1785 RepID=UPI00342BB573